MGQAGSQVISNLEKDSNCQYLASLLYPLLMVNLRLTCCSSAFANADLSCTPYSNASPPVSSAELLRLKKRFMKLDQDGSGTITREEFLQIPQIANNPLAHRMIAIFDTE